MYLWGHVALRWNLFLQHTPVADTGEEKDEVSSMEKTAGIRGE